MKSNNFDSDRFFNKLRIQEFSRLDHSAHTYLDYTGGNIYPKSLVDMHCRFLQNAVCGNPHSNNPASLLSEKFLIKARKRVLEFFNAHDYYCIFTNNASGALQIVGECYPFSNGHLLLTADNHNSVNGLREYCRNKRGTHTYSPMNHDDLSIDEPALLQQLNAYRDRENKLFAFPAQSNASGVQHPLSLVEKAQQLGWDVLLDAAAFVPTSKLDLTLICPDFVAISFYKIFGYPTGIGCLLVKRSTFTRLKKPWFAGGTILLSATRPNSHFSKADHAKFENGTVNYLGIPAIINGLDFISEITMKAISNRIKDLSNTLVTALTNLRHENGRPLITLYGPKGIQNRGGTFLMNFFDLNGRQYPFLEIERLAGKHKISLRTGCFCNPGVDELIHRITAEELETYFESRNEGDYHDMTSFLGKMRGAVRISIGLPTTRYDISKFLLFVRSYINKPFKTKSPLSETDEVT